MGHITVVGLLCLMEIFIFCGFEVTILPLETLSLEIFFDLFSVFGCDFRCHFIYFCASADTHSHLQLFYRIINRRITHINSKTHSLFLLSHISTLFLVTLMLDYPFAVFQQE